MEPTLYERKPETDPSPSVEEAPDAYCRRVSTEILAECAARDTARELRAESFRRACESPAAIHCATSEREAPSNGGDHHADTITIVYSDQYAKEAFHSAFEGTFGSAYTGPR